MTREEKLQKAHQMFDGRELLIELKWQREYFKRGYVSSQEELFNLWIFDECIKALQKLCEDAVSRKAVLEVIDDCNSDGLKGIFCSYDDGERFKKYIKNLSSVTPQEPSYNAVNSLVESKLKNPKAKNFDILHFVADNAGLSTFEAIEKAYIIGVSEQESMLKKIRAEIAEISKKYPMTMDYENGLKEAIAIIDKNKE